MRSKTSDSADSADSAPPQSYTLTEQTVPKAKPAFDRGRDGTQENKARLVPAHNHRWKRNFCKQRIFAGKE
jgi:hypothetical protein